MFSLHAYVRSATPALLADIAIGASLHRLTLSAAMVNASGRASMMTLLVKVLEHPSAFVTVSSAAYTTGSASFTEKRMALPGMALKSLSPFLTVHARP